MGPHIKIFEIMIEDDIKQGHKNTHGTQDMCEKRNTTKTSPARI